MFTSLLNNDFNIEKSCLLCPPAYSFSIFSSTFDTPFSLPNVIFA